MLPGPRVLILQTVATLRSRLSRLGPPPGSPADTPPHAATASAVSGPPQVTADAEPEPIGPKAPGLPELRERIAGILAKKRPAAARADPSAGELPFVRHETEAGPLYQRILRFGPSHRMGRFAVGDGADADAAMLALLALDPAIAGASTRDYLYVDTETTGLAGGTGTVAFLLGMARFEGNELVLEQLLLRQLGEEAPILARLHAEAARASCLVSYNGKSFDLPLLRTRLLLARLPALPPLPHLDLVHVARRVHGSRLAKCSLIAVEENVLGFVREDDVPSGEVVARYRHFLRTGDDGSLLGVVEHNAWDVVALAALVGLYGSPLVALSGADLVGVARTLRRAGSLEQASGAASEAVERGAGPDALRERAEIARARGERDAAVADLERLLAQVDDPPARLALAKLYEHHVGAPDQALRLVEQGTSEGEEQSTRRRARLATKVARESKQGVLPGVPAPRRRKKG